MRYATKRSGACQERVSREGGSGSASTAWGTTGLSQVARLNETSYWQHARCKT